MTKTIRRLALSALLSMSAHSSYGYESLDRSIAIVGDDIVLASELALKIELLKERMGDKVNDTPQAVLQQQVLDHLIVEKLQLQIAKNSGMRISEAEVTRSIDSLIEKLDKDSVNIDDYLTTKSMTMADLREEIRNEILISQVQQRQVNRRIKITEQEVNNFLKSKRGKAWSSPRYNLEHILINKGEQQQAILSKVQAALNKGNDFNDTAKQFSDGSNAKKGGKFGWKLAEELPELFVEKVKNLEKGEVSAPFESAAGLHLLKLADKKGTDATIIEQAKVRHILIKNSMVVSDEDAQARLRELRSQALKDDSFTELARDYSEDIGSMLNGGDLGWSTPGQFVPEFEEVMNKTATKDISEPFKSQFGWHILLVEDRRREDMSAVVTRNRAADLLRKQRFNDELQLWLQELRDQAYISVLI